MLKNSVDILTIFAGKLILQVASKHLMLQKNLYFKKVHVLHAYGLAGLFRSGKEGRRKGNIQEHRWVTLYNVIEI